jgi:hypothetical protein
LLSDHALSRALARAGLRAPVRFEEVTPSTQALALAMAADGAPEWTLVAAGHQTAGRGRLERTWHDRAGSSLLVSVVLRPSLAPGDAGLLSLLAGAALAETIETVGDQRAVCKWPNDVLIGGRKAAGILAEAVLAPGGDAFEYVVLGIGANLGEAPLEQPDAAAISACSRPAARRRIPRSVRRCSPRTAIAAPRSASASERPRPTATSSRASRRISSRMAVSSSSATAATASSFGSATSSISRCRGRAAERVARTARVSSAA